MRLPAHSTIAAQRQARLPSQPNRETSLKDNERVVLNLTHPLTKPPRAEYRGAHAHVGRAAGDGDLEIGGHPHRDHRQSVPRGAVGEPGEVPAWILAFRRDAHQTRNLRPEALPAGNDE